MGRCSPCSPTAKPGRARPSHSRWERASAPHSGRSTPWRLRTRCRRSAAGGRDAGRLRPFPDSRRPCCSPPLCRSTRLGRMRTAQAEIVREYGPFPGADHVHGVTFDGQHVWFASGDKVSALDPANGRVVRSIEVAAHAGTAFDGQYLYQIAEDRIQKVDPKSGRVLSTIPSPGGGGDSGLAWAEGSLWVGQHRARKIHQIDPATGAILRTIESNRVVTGVTWVDGELWHGTWEGDESDVRRIDPQTGEVIERLEMPSGTGVSGLESDGGDQFFCGGGSSGKLRAVRRPRRGSAKIPAGSKSK